MYYNFVDIIILRWVHQKPEFLRERQTQLIPPWRYLCLFFPIIIICCLLWRDRSENKLFSRPTTLFPHRVRLRVSGWFGRRTGVVERWELDYIRVWIGEGVAPRWMSIARKQERPTDPKRPIIHFSRSVFILHRITYAYIEVSTDDNTILTSSFIRVQFILYLKFDRA